MQNKLKITTTNSTLDEHDASSQQNDKNRRQFNFVRASDKTQNFPGQQCEINRASLNETTTLDRRNILHWDDDNLKPNSKDSNNRLYSTNNFQKYNNSNHYNKWQNKVPEKSINSRLQNELNNLRNTSGQFNQRNFGTLKKFGVSCQNLPSATSVVETNLSAKNMKNLSKSEVNLSAKNTPIKNSRFELMTKFFGFNKNNKIDPIVSSSLEGKIDDKNRTGWMKNISNYFIKKSRRTSNG